MDRSKRSKSVIFITLINLHTAGLLPYPAYQNIRTKIAPQARKLASSPFFEEKNKVKEADTTLYLCIPL